MCTTNQGTGKRSGDNAGNNGSGNLYPSMAEIVRDFLAEMGNPPRGENGISSGGNTSSGGHTQDNGNPHGEELLRDVLANMFHSQQGGNNHSPSAPPPPPAEHQNGPWHRPDNNSRDCCGEWLRQTFCSRPQRCPTCNQYGNPLTAFASNFGPNVFTGIMMVLPILILPRIFLALGLFAFIVRSLGWPVKAFMAAAFAFYVLMSVDSCLITVLALFALFKTCVLRRPLLDRARWNRRLSVPQY